MHERLFDARRRAIGACVSGLTGHSPSADPAHDTIEQVEAAALALGYRPHLAGINLRTGRTHAIGLFLPLERPGEINNLAASLIEGVSAYQSIIG